MKIISTLRTIFLNKEDKELIDLINSSDDKVLSSEEKKQWINLLTQMTNKHKKQLKKILINAENKIKKLDYIKEGMKKFYKDDLNKIYKFNSILENILKIFENNLSVLGNLSKNPIKRSVNNILNLNNLNNFRNFYKFHKNYLCKNKIKNTIKVPEKYGFLFKMVYKAILQARKYLLFNKYLSEYEIDNIKNKLEKAKNIKKDDKNNKLLLEYLYQIQQGRDIRDIEIEIRNRNKEIENELINVAGVFGKILKEIEYIENKQDLLDKEEVNKFNKNLAKIYTYLYYC